MAETPQQIIAKLKLTADRKESYKKLTAKATSNTYVINELQGILTGLSSLPTSELKSKTGLSKEDVDQLRQWRDKVVNEVSKTSGKSFRDGKFVPGQEAENVAARQQNIKGLQAASAPGLERSQRGLMGEIGTAASNFITGYQAPRRGAELVKRGLPPELALSGINQDDATARIASEFGYGYGQNLAPTMASIPGLIGGGAVASGIDRLVGSRLPNTGVFGLLRAGGQIGGAMLGAQATGGLYNKFAGPYTGLSEDQAGQVQGTIGRKLGGAAEQLGKFGATATIFGAPATNDKGQLAFFEGAGYNRSMRELLRNPNRAMNDPAVKEFLGDIAERSSSVSSTIDEQHNNYQARIAKFIEVNGREPSRAEKDGMGVLTPQQRLSELAPDIVFGGLTRYGKGLNPFGLLQQGRQAGQPNAPVSPTTPQQQQGQQAGSTGSAQPPLTMGALQPTSGGGLFNFNVKLKRGNTLTPHTIAFDQSTGLATVNPTVDIVPGSIARAATERLATNPSATVGNTDLSIRAITPDGSILVLSKDNVSGAQTLQTMSYNNLPPALQNNVNGVLRNTRLGSLVFNPAKFPTTPSYNPTVDSLKSFEDDFKTKINIDGTEINARVVDVRGDMATVVLPSGIELTLPKAFFATEPTKQVGRLTGVRRLKGLTYKVGTVKQPVSAEYGGTDHFVAEPRRPAMQADPTKWADSYRRIPTPAEQMPVGTVVNLGAIDGERQVGVVLEYTAFDISGAPAAGYRIQSLNDPRMEPFMIPHDPDYIKPLARGENPFVRGAAPAAAVTAPAPAAVAPVAPVVPGAGAGGATTVPSTTIPSITAPPVSVDATALGQAVTDAPTVIPTLVDYFKSAMESTSPTDEQDGILDVDAISDAIGYDNVDALDEMITAAVDAGLIDITDDGDYDFSVVSQADPTIVLDRILNQLNTKLSSMAPVPPVAAVASGGTNPVTNPVVPGSPAAVPATSVVPGVPAAAVPASTVVPGAPAAVPAATPAASTNRVNLVQLAIPMTPDEEVIAKKITDEYNSTDPTADQLRSVTLNLDDLSASTGVDKGALQTVLSKMWGSDTIRRVAGDTYDLSKLHQPKTTASPSASTTPATTTGNPQLDISTVTPEVWNAMHPELKIYLLARSVQDDAILADVVKADIAAFDKAFPKDGSTATYGVNDDGSFTPDYVNLTRAIQNGVAKYLNDRGLPVPDLALFQPVVDHALDGLLGGTLSPINPTDPMIAKLSGNLTNARVNGSQTAFAPGEKITVKIAGSTPTTPPSTPTPQPSAQPAVTATVTPEEPTTGEGEDSTLPVSTASETRAPKPPSREYNPEPPETQKFPYGNEFKEPAAEGSLPVSMEDYRSGKTRYRRQTAGEEVAKPITLTQFRNAVPSWATGVDGFKRFVGKFVAPLVDAFGTGKTDQLELDLTGVKDKDDLYIRLQDVFGQSPEQAAALAEWVDRWSLGWAREFARLHGINTMERLRASRVTEDPAVDTRFLTKTNETWKENYREQMLPKNTAENAQILKALQTAFYTQRLGAIGVLPAVKKGLFNTTGMAFSIGGDGKRTINVIIALHGKENYVTQVHEINHALVRSLYAPMIHQLAAKIYPTYRQTTNPNKQREIQKDIEERIVTEITNSMFNAPSDVNIFTENDNVEGGFDVTLNKLFGEMGQLMRDSIDGSKDNPNDVSSKGYRGWQRPFPTDPAKQKGLAVGTPLIIKETVFGGRKVSKTYVLKEPIRPGSPIKVETITQKLKRENAKPGKWDVTKEKTKDIDPLTIDSIGQTEVKTLSKPVNQYLTNFMGHWYDYTVQMVNAHNPDVNMSDVNFDGMSVVELQRTTVGYRWWDDVEQAKNEFPIYQGSDFSDDRIQKRMSESYLGWADQGGYESYREAKGIPVESFYLTSGLPAELSTPALVQSEVIAATSLVSDSTTMTDAGVQNAEMSMEELLYQAMIESGTADPDFMNKKLPTADPQFMNKAIEDISEDDGDISEEDLADYSGDVSTEALAAVEGESVTSIEATLTPQEREAQRQRKLNELNRASTKNLSMAVIEQAKVNETGKDIGQRYIKAVERLILTKMVPAIVTQYVKPKHYWLQNVNLKTSPDGRTWYTTGDRIGEDLVGTLYHSSTEAVKSVLSQLIPIVKEDGKYDTDLVRRAYKDDNGIVQYETIKYGDAWNYMRKEINRSAQNAVNDLRRKTTDIPDADRRNPFISAAKLQILSDGILREGTASFDEEAVRRATSIAAFKLWTKSQGDPIPSNRGTSVDILSLRIPPAVKTAIKDILSDNSIPDYRKSVDIYFAILNEPSLVTGVNSNPLFRIIHQPYQTRDNSYSHISILQTMFKYENGVLYVPKFSLKQLNKVNEQIANTYQREVMTQNASNIIYLNSVIGTDEGGRSVGEDVMGTGGSPADLVSEFGNNASEYLYKHRVVKSVAEIMQGSNFVKDFAGSSYGMSLYDARKGNPRQEKIEITLAKYNATEMERTRLSKMSPPEKLAAGKERQQKDRAVRVQDYNNFVNDIVTDMQSGVDKVLIDWATTTEKAQASVDLYNALKMFSTKGNFTVEDITDLIKKKVIGADRTSVVNALKKLRTNEHTFAAFSHAMSVLESTVTKAQEIGRETAEYHQLNLTLTPIESVILSTRSANLRQYGIIPVETGNSVRPDQVMAGLRIGTEKYKTAVNNIITKINTIEGTKLNQWYGDNVGGYASQVQMVVAQLDATINELEKKIPWLWRKMQDLTLNERRLHILLERTPYINRDEKGNVRPDPLLVAFGRRMRGREVMRSIRAKSEDEVTVDDIQATIDATVDALYGSMVIQPQSSFTQRMMEGEKVVTHQRLSQVKDNTVVQKIQDALNGNAINSRGALRGVSLYERALNLAGLASNQNQILTDEQLASIARFGNEKEPAVVQSLLFSQLQQQRDDFIKGGIQNYLKNQGKALEAMTVQDLNDYLSSMDRNDAFSVMSNIMKVLTQDRSALLPFITYTGRLPYADEIGLIANQIKDSDKPADLAKAFKRVEAEFKQMQEKVARFGLEYMTNAASVTAIQATVDSETTRRSVSYGLTLNDPSTNANPVDADIRRQIVNQQSIFGDKDSKNILENFGDIHKAVNDLIYAEISRAIAKLKASGTEGSMQKVTQLEAMLSSPVDDIAANTAIVNMLPKEVSSAIFAYNKFKSETDLLTATNVNDIIWGKAMTKQDMRGRGKTNIPAPGEKRTSTYATTPQYIFAQAVRKRTEKVITDFVNDLYGSDMTFAKTKGALRGFDAPTLIKILNDPAFADRPENVEIKLRLQALTSSIAKDMVQGRAEIVRALRDPIYSTYRYEYAVPGNKNLVNVFDAAGKKVMTIDYKSSLYTRPESQSVFSSPSGTSARPNSYTATSLIDMMMSMENAIVSKVQPDFFDKYPESQRDALKKMYESNVEAEKKTRAEIVKQVTSLQKLRVMPAEYWHGRDRVEAVRPSAEPMFMNRKLDTAQRIDSFIGTRSPDTVDDYVKPVINKWMMPDANGLKRVQLNVDGVPAWDGYSYTVQAADGSRSHIYSNLRTMGLEHHKALEIYALTEHPEFKAWQSGDLVESVRLISPGSLEYHGISMTSDEKDKLNLVMNAQSLTNAVDDYNTRPTAKNYENLKYWYDEVLGVDDKGRPLTPEQLEKRVQDIANDSIKLESVRVQADTLKSTANTTSVQYFSNPILSHMEGQKQVRTAKPFTTLAFGMATNGPFNYGAPGIRIHDLGSGLHKNDNLKQQPRWIKMNNPLVIDLKNNGIDAPSLQPHFEKAFSRGHDGLVFTNYRDSMFSPTSRNIAITLTDNNVKSVATMHVESEGVRVDGKLPMAEPMYMNRRIEAPLTRAEAPTLIAEPLEEVQKTGLEIVGEGASRVYDEYQAFTRSALSLDFAFTLIQGGRAALGLVTGRPMDSVQALKALVYSVAGLAPNTSITLFGKEIGFDKLGRRSYMSMYLAMTKDPYWEVMKKIRVPLHMLNMEKRIEAERDRLYREAEGTINYEDIPIDLMQYDERGNLTDFFESNTIIGSMPFQGMFERQISLQHDVLLFSLIKQHLQKNPIFEGIPIEELGDHEYAQLAANFISLTMGDFQYSTDERVDAKWGRLGKIVFVAPRWLFANVLLNPIVNRHVSASPKMRRLMGEKNRVFDLYPKDLVDRNPYLAKYQGKTYWNTLLLLLGLQLFHKFRGMLTNDGRYNANPKKFGSFRNGDWDISDSTGTFDAINVPLGYYAALTGGDPEKQDRYGANSTTEYMMTIANTLGYRASPVLTKPLQALYGKDVVNKPVWATDKFLELSYKEMGRPFLNNIGMDVPPSLEVATFWTSQLPTAWSEGMQSYTEAKNQGKDKDVANAIALQQFMLSGIGMRIKYKPYVPESTMKFERRLKAFERATTYVPKITDILATKDPKKLITGLK